MVVEMPGYVCRIIETLNMAGFRAYAVGGCVRDSLMGVPPHDWDVCTNARPKQVEACFTHHKTLETGIKHGTVTVIIDKNQVEITTF